MREWDGLIQRLSTNKTAPGTLWRNFWRVYDETIFFFEETPQRIKIEGL